MAMVEARTRVAAPPSELSVLHGRAQALVVQIGDLGRRHQPLPPNQIALELDRLIEQTLAAASAERRYELLSHAARSVRWCVSQLAKGAQGVTDTRPTEAVEELIQTRALLQSLR